MDLKVVRLVLECELGEHVSNDGWVRLNICKVGLGCYRLYLGCLKRDFDIVCRYIRDVYKIDCGFVCRNKRKGKRKYVSRDIGGDEFKDAFSCIEDISSRIKRIEDIIGYDVGKVVSNELGFKSIMPKIVSIYKGIDDKYVLDIDLGSNKDADDIWEKLVNRYSIKEYKVVSKQESFKRYRVEYDSLDDLNAIYVVCKLYSW